MWLNLFKYIISALESKPELLKKGIDAFLDVIESAVEKSETKIDDTLVLPICKLIRSTLKIED